MSKTNFADGSHLTPIFMNTIYNTTGGHSHDGQSLDGHAQKIDLSSMVTNVLPGVNYTPPDLGTTGAGGTNNSLYYDRVSGLAALLTAIDNKLLNLGVVIEGVFPVSFSTGFSPEQKIECSYRIVVSTSSPVIPSFCTVCFPKIQAMSSGPVSTFIADGTHGTTPLPAAIRPNTSLCMTDPPDAGGDALPSLYFPIIVDRGNSLEHGFCRIYVSGALRFYTGITSSSYVAKSIWPLATYRGFPAFAITYPLNISTTSP